VEYATKAVENSETVCGVRCKDGVVLGCEKQFFSKLLIEGSNRRIYNIENSIGMAVCGKIPDGRSIVQRARSEAADYLKTFSIPIVGNILSDRMQIFVHQFTLYGGYRPYGSAVLIASYDEFDQYNLHMVEPSGHCYGYHACAHGKGRQICKGEFEKRDFKQLTCVEALPFIAKM
jgi:20S proteasome subunit alpha 7